VNDTGAVGSWSIGKGDALAYSFTGARDMAELYVKTAVELRASSPT